MKIEIVEDGGIKAGVNHHLKGEVLISGDDDQAATYAGWVQVGWAKNLETGEQNDRAPGPNKLDVDSIRQTVASEVK